MPITYTVGLNRSYVSATAAGKLTAEEISNYANAVEADENVVEGFVELFDVSRIEESQIDQSGLDKIAQIVRTGKKRSMGSRLAIVVAKGDSFDRARYYERIASDIHNVIVFNSRDVAEIWLGVRQPTGGSNKEQKGE